LLPLWALQGHVRLSAHQTNFTVSMETYFVTCLFGIPTYVHVLLYAAFPTALFKKNLTGQSRPGRRGSRERWAIFLVLLRSVNLQRDSPGGGEFQLKTLQTYSFHLGEKVFSASMPARTLLEESTSHRVHFFFHLAPVFPNKTTIVSSDWSL
jgi:hypothetical protein